MQKSVINSIMYEMFSQFKNNNMPIIEYFSGI